MSVPSIQPSSAEYAPFYAGYIALVPSGDITHTLQRQKDAMQELLSGLSEQQAGYRYAPGKWSVKEVVGHLIDAERIFACRALRFARNDATPLPGFEEDDYVLHGRFDERRLSDILREYGNVRAATIDLFASLHEEAWSRTGTANGAVVSVRALAWITAGHELHHRNVVQTRYMGE